MEASHKTHRPHIKVGKDEEEEEEEEVFSNEYGTPVCNGCTLRHVNNRLYWHLGIKLNMTLC